jgi:streptogramin lyase
MATVAAVAVALLVWPSTEVTRREAPRPAGVDLPDDLPSGSVPIPVGDGPSEVAVGDGALWVSNVDDETVSRIDPVTNEASVTVQLSGPPGDLAVGDGGEVWVTIPALGAVHRIDPVTNATTPDRRIEVAPADTALDLAIDEFLWVSVVERELVQIDLTTGDEIRRIGWVQPVNVAARDGRVFVLDVSGIVREVDPATGEPTALELSFDVEGRGDVHFDDGTIWVAEGDGSTLYSAAVEGGEIESHPFRGAYMEMVHTEDGVVVLSETGDGGGVLSLIDPETSETTELAEIDGEPRDLVQGLGDLWVSAYASDLLLRIPSLP